MELDFAFICDYAEVGGRINALGIGLDTIFTKELPARHPHLHVVAQFRTSITEAGQKRLGIQLIDADGKPVIPPLEGIVDIRPPEAGIEAKGRMGVGLDNVTFEQYGDYSLHILIDGNLLRSIGFRVAEPPSTN